jgi:hypothetical protein
MRWVRDALTPHAGTAATSFAQAWAATELAQRAMRARMNFILIGGWVLVSDLELNW